MTLCVCGEGGGQCWWLWREGLIAKLGPLSVLFHIDHKLLHFTGFSGQDEGPHSLVFFVQNSSFCHFLLPLFSFLSSGSPSFI